MVLGKASNMKKEERKKAEIEYLVVFVVVHYPCSGGSSVVNRIKKFQKISQNCPLESYKKFYCHDTGIFLPSTICLGR